MGFHVIEQFLFKVHYVTETATCNSKDKKKGKTSGLLHINMK